LDLVLNTHRGSCSRMGSPNDSILIQKKVVNNCGKNPI